MRKLSDLEFKEFELEIQKIGLIKRWWGDLYTRFGKTEDNYPIIYRNSIYKYLYAFLTKSETTTKDDLDLLMINVIRTNIPAKFQGYKISLMDNINSEDEDFDINISLSYREYIL